MGARSTRRKKKARRDRSSASTAMFSVPFQARSHQNRTLHNWSLIFGERSYSAETAEQPQKSSLILMSIMLRLSRPKILNRSRGRLTTGSVPEEISEKQPSAHQ